MEKRTLRDIEVKKDFIKFMEDRVKENEAENLRLKENIDTTKKLIGELCDCRLPNGMSSWDTKDNTCSLCGKQWYLLGER